MDTSSDFGKPLAEESATAPKPEPVEEQPVAPGTPPVPEPVMTPSQENTENNGVLDVLKDAGKGLFAGAEGAVAGVRQTARGIADATGLSDAIGDRETNAQPLEKGAPEPEGIVGHLTAAVTQAALGYALGGVALRAAKLGSTAGAVAQSAIGTPLVADANQERVSNVLMQFPWLAPIVQPLAQNPTDSVLMSKVKAGIEDVIGTGAAASVFKGMQLLYMKAAGKYSEPAIAKVEAEVAQGAQKAAAPPVVEPADAAYKAEQAAYHGDDPAAAGPASAKHYADAKAANAAKAAEPVTLKKVDGTPVATLSPAASEKFRKLQDKLVINNEMGKVEKPTLGADASAAKQGVPLRPNLNEAPNVVLQTLEDLGKLTKIDPKSTVRSEESIREVAGMLSQKPEEFVANLKSFNKSAESIESIALGARAHLIAQGEVLVGHAQRALMGDAAAREAHTKLFTELADVQAQLARAATNLGRGLHSFGMATGKFDAAAMAAKMKNPAEAKKMEELIVATGGDADKIAHIISIQQMSWFQKAVGVHNEYWTGLGLLSRVATQTANIVPTAANVFMEPTSMMVGGVMQGLTGHGWASAREAVGIYHGLMTSFGDSFHYAWLAAKSERAILSQAGTQEQKTQYISSLTFNMDQNALPGLFVDIIGNITRMSFRGLTAGDEFFKQMSYRAKVAATASREAVDRVKAGTMQRTEVDAHVKQALQDSIDEQGRGILPDALKYAEKAAFVADLKIATIGGFPSAGEVMARVSGNHPVIRGTLLPFVKTPTNVTRTTFEYTPIIGQFRKQFYEDLKEGGEKQAMAMGKFAIGSGMYIGAMKLVLDGRITGAPPAPGVVVPAGYKPYSFIWKGMGENGGDLYLSYQRMQPFGDILGLTHDFAKSTGMMDADTRDGVAESMKMMVSKFLDADAGEKWNMGADAATSVGSSYIKSLISKTYFRNMTEFFSTFSGYNSEDQMLRWVQNYTASHVPGIVSSMNPDDTVREVRSTLDAIMARIPGLSQTLPAKRDYFGNIHDVRVGYPLTMINPFSMSETKADPVMNELSRLSTSEAKTSFEAPASTYTIAGKQQDLKTIKNDQGVTAYDRMNELMKTVSPPGHSGKNFHDYLEQQMNGPRYDLGKESQTLDGGQHDFIGLRVKIVKKAEGEYRAAALEQVKNEFKTQLGIESARRDTINTKIGRTKVGVGLYDKILELAK